MRAKELAQPRIESKRVAGTVASDNVEDLRDLPDVWQTKGLEGTEEEFRDSGLTGRTGRGAIPANMHILYHSR